MVLVKVASQARSVITQPLVCYKHQQNVTKYQVSNYFFIQYAPHFMSRKDHLLNNLPLILAINRALIR